MDNKDIIYYDSKLSINGTIEQLLDWSYRYDRDYSDEALQKISEFAKSAGMGERAMIPILVMKDRIRRNKEDKTLPYEQMLLDKLFYDKIQFETETEYGNVVIREDCDFVLIAIYDSDEEGDWIATSEIPIQEFMNGGDDPDNYLEHLIGATIAYNKQYDG